MAIGSNVLFGSTQSTSGGRSSTENHLLQFRAGKATLGGDKYVRADKRKGLVQIEQSKEDQLMHFKWRPRPQGSVTSTLPAEDDLIIFPDDVTFCRVGSCGEDGRVYVLKFKSYDRKLFFWMQEPKTDRDNEYCSKVNQLLNNPPTASSGSESILSTRGSSKGGGGSKKSRISGGSSSSRVQNMMESMANSSSLQSILANMSQDQLANLLGDSLSGVGGGGASNGSEHGSGDHSSGGGGAGSLGSFASLLAASAANTSGTNSGGGGGDKQVAAANTTESTSTPVSTGGGAGSGGQIKLSDLQSALSGIKGSGAGGTGAPLDLSSLKDSSLPLDLSDGATLDTLSPILQDEKFVEKLRELVPEEERSSETVISDTVRSPQFKQALSLFSTAFQSGSLGPLMREFNFGSKIVESADSGDLSQFINDLKEDGKPSDTDEKSDKS